MRRFNAAFGMATVCNFVSRLNGRIVFGGTATALARAARNDAPTHRHRTR